MPTKAALLKRTKVREEPGLARLCSACCSASGGLGTHFALCCSPAAARSAGPQAALEQELQVLGLPTAGLKQELVDRLHSALAAGAAGPDAAAAPAEASQLSASKGLAKGGSGVAAAGGGTAAPEPQPELAKLTKVRGATHTCTSCGPGASPGRAARVAALWHTPLCSC